MFKVSLFLKLKTKHKNFISGSAGWLLSDYRPKNFRKKESVLAQEMRLIEAITKKEIIPKPSILIKDEKYKILANNVICAGGGNYWPRTWGWRNYQVLATL